MRISLLIFSAMVGLIFALIGAAKASEPADLEDIDIPQSVLAAVDDYQDRMFVIGKTQTREKLPGAAHLVSSAELEKFEYSDIHRMLRLVPGVNIQEEDGYGLRPNIGLRGSGVERSSRITLMEDGVLIAPAPYAAPDAYYFPTAGRMDRIEVRTGSSAIKFGPRTVGGAINLISSPIGDGTGGRIEGRYGSDNFYTVHASGSFVGEHAAAMIEGYMSGADGFKKLEGGGGTGFNIQDFVAKFRLNTSQDADVYQSLELKIGHTNNDSDESYLGLTDADFAATPYRRYAASQLDHMDTEHWQVQLTHFIQPSSSIDVTTVFYYNDFARDWFKLDDIDFGDERGRFSPRSVFANPDAFAEVLAVLRGEADSPDDALQLRHNNRAYYSWGVQSVMQARFNTGGASHKLEIGLRYHKDEEDRLQNREKFRMEDGVMILTTVDPLGSQANRVSRGKALAVFVQDEISIGRWVIMPGIRFEHITLTRLDFSTADADRSDGPAGLRENTLDVFIPGLGVTFDAGGGLTLLVGLYRGFAPPGVGDNDADEEKSTNFEIGFRYNKNSLQVEVIGFFNRYSNILGTCTNSVGCEGSIGDQFNGGRANIIGLETRLDYVVRLGNGVDMPLRFNYTYTDAEFREDFSDSFWGDVSAGDKLPYIPRHQGYASMGIETARWGVTLSVSFVGALRTEAGQGPIPQMEKVPSHAVVDLAGYYQLTEQVRLFVAVDNLLDNTYAVARRPYGLRPGKPLTVQGGIGLTF